MKKKFVVLVGFAAFVSAYLGCASIRNVEYFAPMPRGNDIKVLAQARGLKEVARINIDGTSDFYLAIMEREKPPTAKLVFQLGATKTMRFQGAQVSINEIGGRRSLDGIIDAIQGIYIEEGRSTFKYFKVTDELIGESIKYKGFLGKEEIAPRQFEVNIKFGAQLPRRFTLHLPPIELSGKKIYLPEVEFNLAKGIAYEDALP